LVKRLSSPQNAASTNLWAKDEEGVVGCNLADIDPGVMLRAICSAGVYRPFAGLRLPNKIEPSTSSIPSSFSSSLLLFLCLAAK
jgi:hypothetical protein